MAVETHRGGGRCLMVAARRTALILGILPLGGCGGANFGADLTSRPRATTVSAEGPAEQSYPGDEPFGIFHAESSRSAGLGSDAQSDAHASPEGTADASASIDNGGEASGTFQIGHALTNDGGRQIDLDVTVRFHYEYEAKASQTPARVDGGVGLKLYARDQRNRLLRNDDLVAYTLEQGDSAGSAEKEIRFSVPLGPSGTVSVFLAGQSRVSAEFGRSAACSLKVSGLKMSVTAHPAPPASAAPSRNETTTPGDEQR